MSYALHAEAERDLADATEFYEHQTGPVLASRFLDGFVHVAKLLFEFPARDTRVRHRVKYMDRLPGLQPPARRARRGLPRPAHQWLAGLPQRLIVVDWSSL